MARYRLWLQSSLSVVLALALVQAAAAQFNWSGALTPTASFSGKPAVSTGTTCKVYSLSDLGDDPKLCKWIAETIPEMIQPASWKQTDAKINFYAPSKILVISNTPAVHAQVDEYLQNMKKSVAQSRPTATPGLMPAQFAVPDSVRAGQGVQTGPGGYPVPFTPQTPKHLFHFIIRYEGEGIIDSNVVGFAKALKEELSASKSESLSPQAAAALRTPPVSYPEQVVVGGMFGGLVGQSVGATTDKVTTALSTKNNAPVMPPADAPPARSSEVVPAPASNTLPTPLPPSPGGAIPGR